jgi:hypothetical protein
MAEWWSIEVFHGEFSADRWRDAYSSAFIESAVTHGAADWTWHQHRWGVVFEVCFADDAAWEVFRALPQVRAALDAVPDKVNGLLIYRGRGGGAGRPSRRPRRPSAGAGALELPEPAVTDVVADVTRAWQEEHGPQHPGAQDEPVAVPGHSLSRAAGGPVL